MQPTHPFNPYPYQPLMRYYYNGGVDPQRVSKFKAENPELAQHVDSIWQFTDWMATNFPDLYRIVTAQSPALVDPVEAVAMVATPSGRYMSWAKTGLSGMDGWTVDETGLNVWTADPIPGVAGPVEGTGGSDSSIGGAVTDWGNKIIDLAKGFLVYDTQKKIIDVNVKRAEKGLSPIPLSAFSPQVNVGVSPEVQNLGMLAIGGLVIVGLLAAARRRS